MNSTIAIYSLRFAIFVLVQAIICNNINLFGYINPYIYTIFIFLFPIRETRINLLLISFALGFTIDIFANSGGVHAGAAVTLAYVRPVLLKTAFGVQYEYQSVKFNNTKFGDLISYLAIGILVHHFILFSLEIFNISNILLILKKTLFSSIFTLILSILIIIIFSQNRK